MSEKLPLCRETRNLLDTYAYTGDRSFSVLNSGLHPGLMLEKFSPDPQEVKRIGERKHVFYSSWAVMAGANNHPLRKIAEGVQERRKALILSSKSRGYESVTFHGQVNWRLVIGLGTAHPYETGFTLHPTYGYPYLPDSAVKGVARHGFLLQVAAKLNIYPCSLEIAQKLKEANEMTPLSRLEALFSLPPKPEWQEKRTELLKLLKSDGDFPERISSPDKIREQTLESLESAGGVLFREAFGSKQCEGQVIFHDALAEMWQFEVDVMTPHYNNYYGERQPPADNGKPIPILFLTLGRKTRFRFDLESVNSDLLTSVKKALVRALSETGIGAKTGVGYGGISIHSKPETGS